MIVDRPACIDIAAIGFKGCHLPAQSDTSAVTYRGTKTQNCAKINCLCAA